jgi:hypothetical protein
MNSLKTANHKSNSLPDKPVSGRETCPSKSNTFAIEVLVVDSKDKPVTNINLEIKNSEEKSCATITNREGKCRFDGLDDGEFQFSLKKIAGALWSIEKNEPLSKELAKSTKQAVWSESKKQDTTAKQHVAKYDECFTSIAAQYGFDPESLWNDPSNMELKEKRKNMNILAEGDVVHIPEKTVKWENVKSGNCYTIKIADLMSSIQLQLLNTNGDKRPNVNYILSIKTKSNQTIPDKKGTTDSDGFMNEPVPPDADIATVVVIENGNEDRYELKLGGLDPIDTLRGKQQRLSNIGFYCEYEEELGESTRDAINLFQAQYELKVTGEFDEETVKKLEEICKC